MIRSRCCQAPGEQAQVGDEEPGGAALDGGLKIFSQAAAAAEPGKGALDHPSPRQQLEAFDTGRALDDVDRPWAAIGDGALQLRPPVDAIGKDMPQGGM